MNGMNWESAGLLMTYLDDLLEKMRLYGAEWVTYNFSQEKIELLERGDILRMSKESVAVKRMLAARAGYKSFIVVSYLEGRKGDFKWSLRLLENVAKKVTPEKSMPARPRFIENIFQE